MGSQLTNAGVPALAMTVTDADGESVTSIELWGGAIGTAVPVAAIRTYTNTNTFTFNSGDVQNIQPDNSTWYYYAVITQEDGNKIVTSPIWYTRADAVLPVILTGLRARYDEPNNEVIVTWSTAQESNSRSFVVERSSEGSSYTAIGTVAAAGNSSRPINYSFTDVNPLQGTNYYRLRQVDLDGDTRNSGIVKVMIGKGLYVSYGPNPATHVLNVNIRNNRGPITVQLTDLNGRLLQQRNLSSTAAQTIQLPVNHLSKGVYLLKLIKRYVPAESDQHRKHPDREDYDQIRSTTT
jgi:trimeric autotransporter adhesin